MNTSFQHEITLLADEFVRENCIVFAGSDISGQYVDSTGIKYPGLPTLGEILQELNLTQNDLKDQVSLSHALAMKSIMDGRTAMVHFLMDKIDNPTINPLPIHDEIVKLPLTAIITTTLDTLLERTLVQSNINFRVIVNDKDIPFFRSSRIPLLKLHGSIDQPESIRATTDDLIEIFQAQPLLGDLLRVLCAQKTILFIGYNLDDLDFIQFYGSLQRHLGSLLPVSYAIHPNPSPNMVKYWSQRGIQIITSDPTEFMQRLNSYIIFKSTSPHMVIKKDAISWIEDPFLRTFLGIGRLPTANQIIDGISNAILHQLESDLPFETIAQRVRDVVDSLIEYRPKHRALLTLRDETIPQWLPPICSSKKEARGKVLDFVNRRSNARKLLGQKGAKFVNSGDRILTYSQSTCVLEVINNALYQYPKDEIKILIAECRPKSPEIFQDALTIIRATKSKGTHFLLVPDIAIGHLMRLGQITKVFMGSHGITVFPNKEVRVTNTVGTLTICLLAQKYSIPVYFFAEEGKITYAKNTNQSSFSYNLYPEEILFDDKDFRLLRTLGGRTLELINPGFDDISSNEVAFFVVSEEKIIEATPLVS